MDSSKYIVENPDLVEKKSVDGAGRLYLGKEYAGDEIEIVVKVLEEGEGE